MKPWVLMVVIISLAFMQKVRQQRNCPASISKPSSPYRHPIAQIIIHVITIPSHDTDVTRCIVSKEQNDVAAPLSHSCALSALCASDLKETRRDFKLWRFSRVSLGKRGGGLVFLYLLSTKLHYSLEQDRGNTMRLESSSNAMINLLLL